MTRILFSGGGTGGGTYPAISVANALTHRHPEAELLWVGSSNGIEGDLVKRAGIPFRGVLSGPLVGVGLRAIPSAVKIALGTLQALLIVARFRPQALLMTGGWPVLPATLACRLLGVPVVIYLPDLEPGGTIKVTSRFAEVVAANFADSAQFFDEVEVRACGYPLRPQVLRAAGFDASGRPLEAPPDARREAAERFGLDLQVPTVLVFGGSKGTSTINQALLAHLPQVVQQADVIHITGREHFEDVQRRAVSLAAAAMSGELRDEEEKNFGRDTIDLDALITQRYHVFDYLHTADMALALAAADVVVSRSGAGALGEYPLFGLPAVLVPLARAWRYQIVNADYLTERGAALKLADDTLHDTLWPTLRTLLTDDDQRAAMAAAAAALRRPDAAACIVDVLMAVRN
jgi:UDP-N-acetylglucosamine--N-acetylmuramyl-(pentapeptide) pyrophosphoryl-undecaprenol N-acetylglucosamine transferase